MSLSLSKKNVLSIMAMTLTIITMIAPADAQTTCTSTSPECCWVVESWKLMGKKTSVSRTDATACCYYLGSTTQNSGIPGVRCSSSGKVTEINWASKSLKGSIPPILGNLVNLQLLILGIGQLSGSIPSSLGNLVNLYDLSLLGINQLNGSIPSSLGNLRRLRELDLGYNQLSGSIPPEIGNLVSLQSLELNHNRFTGSIPPQLENLVNLKSLELHHNQLSGSIPPQLENLVNLKSLRLAGNPGLTGTINLHCGINLDVLGTKVTICGCVAESTPPALYPPPEIDAKCLASHSARSLSKRTQVPGQVAQIGNLIFTCHVDNARNPFADCLNSMAALCDPARTKIYDKGTCKTAVNQMYGKMSDDWQKVRKACGRWPWTQNGITYTGEVYTSDNCVRANSNLIANAYYSVWNPLTQGYENINVTSGLTDSTNVGLWGQVAE